MGLGYLCCQVLSWSLVICLFWRKGISGTRSPPGPWSFLGVEYLWSPGYPTPWIPYPQIPYPRKGHGTRDDLTPQKRHETPHTSPSQTMRVARILLECVLVWIIESLYPFHLCLINFHMSLYVISLYHWNTQILSSIFWLFSTLLPVKRVVYLQIKTKWILEFYHSKYDSKKLNVP